MNWLCAGTDQAPGRLEAVIDQPDGASDQPDAAASDRWTGAGRHPTVDLLTRSRAVMMSQRPVVGLSSWLVDAARRAVDHGLIPTLVTPAATRLTLPTRAAVDAGLLQWVVRVVGGGFYDGMAGTAMAFDDDDFVAGAEVATQFGSVVAPDAWQVLVSLTIEHRAAIQTQLGGAVEILARALTGVRPAGWGTHEPVTEQWSRPELTTFARRRMPTDSQVVVVGAGQNSMTATLRAARTERGVEETLLCLVNAGPVTRPIDDVAAQARAALTEVAGAETAGFAAAHLRPGRADLTEPSHEAAQLLPLSILIGPRAVRALGRERLERAPLPATAVGRPRVPTLRFDLGGRGTSAWMQLADLVSYLGPQRVTAAVPGLADAARPAGSSAATARPGHL
jgi:Family of unknown function (DUF6177)